MAGQVNISRSDTDGGSLANVTIDITASETNRHPDLSNICTKCECLLSTAKDDLKDFKCYSYVALEVSARNGCQFCALVFTQAEKVVTNIGDKVKPYLDLPYHVNIFGDDPHWGLYFGLKSWDIASISMSEWQDESSTIRHDASHNNTGSIHNIELAQKWMHLCQESHAECIKLLNAHHALPTRLIEIGQSNADLRLSIINTDVTPSLPYVTLSHCWGQLEILKLSRSNFASMQVSIPYLDLPQTFKDAVKVARQLAFRYIWIDSLCIIQDDKDDWAREAPRMASVYGGSSLNISAAAAHDGSEGLFFTRDPNPVQTCLVLADPDPDRSALSSRQEFTLNSQSKASGLEVLAPRDPSQKLFYCMDPNVCDRCFKLPLFQRAWVFQERILAPRSLHFGDAQIFWECQSQIFFETSPNGVPDKVNLAHRLAETDITQNMVGFQNLWNGVLEHYSECKLTFASDKLIAVSGIAENFRSRYGGNYMWGIWREQLPEALLWRSWDDTATRLLPLLAPTWSWASITGPINAGHCEHIAHATIHTYFPPPLSSDTETLQIQCEKLSELNSQTLQHLEFTLWNFSPPGSALPAVILRMRLEFDGGDRKRQTLPPALYALSLLSSHGPECTEKGLLVQLVDGKKGRFRRVGTYSSSKQKCETFKLVPKLPLTDYEREFVYERECVGEGREENKFIINLE